MYVCMHACMHVCMYVCMYVYVCMSVCLSVCTEKISPSLCFHGYNFSANIPVYFGSQDTSLQAAQKLPGPLSKVAVH